MFDEGEDYYENQKSAGHVSDERNGFGVSCRVWQGRERNYGECRHGGSCMTGSHDDALR